MVLTRFAFKQTGRKPENHFAVLVGVKGDVFSGIDENCSEQDILGLFGSLSGELFA